MIADRLRTGAHEQPPNEAQEGISRTARSLDSSSKTSVMRSLVTSVLIILVSVSSWTNVAAQSRKILVDVAHSQKFYSDPADGISSELVPTERLKYMTGELARNGAAHNAQLAYQKTPFTANALSGSDLVFIHVPAAKYSPEECKAIREYLEKGGSLFIVIEEDYWATLAQINVNDIVKPFGITFASNNPDRSSGGHSSPGKVTEKKYSIPFHGARIVEGGTPFAYSDQSDANPFGVFAETRGGGRIVAMGEGMVSLYMTEWQGVTGYDCAGFMGEVIGWLLKRQK